MSTTVDIIIKGVAICYRKGTDWHVLFPIDDARCHSIKFSYRKVDHKDDISVGDLAKPGTFIEVTAPNPAFETGEEDDFKNHVLNFTSKIYPVTHPRIQSKAGITEKSVVMTIPNATFSVHKYLQNFPEVPIPDLHEVGTDNKTPLCRLVAHSVKATIVLQGGGQVTVKSEQLTEDFVTEAGASYVLTFNNHCEDLKAGRNDMEMFYEVFEDAEKSDRKFLIGGAGRDGDNKKILVEPPDFADGKPCLVIKITDPNDLP